MSEKLYKLKCRRCGRVFYDRHPNTLYCNYPSEIPSDFGRTCKQMRRVEGRAKVQEEKEALTQGLKSGNLVMTRKYGCISRQDYLQYFDNAKRKNISWKVMLNIKNGEKIMWNYSAKNMSVLMN